ncbi:MAG: hypothetical protein RL721_1112 [Candidatus Eisenbacteria bacterium]
MRCGVGSRGSLLLLIVAALAIAGCATQPEPTGSSAPGFFSGLWHGYTILFGLIASIFDDVRIYAYPNTGFWYDLGYLLGAAAFLRTVKRERS